MPAVRRRRGFQLRFRLRGGPAANQPPPGCVADDERHARRRVRGVRPDGAGHVARLHGQSRVRPEARLHGEAGPGGVAQVGTVAGAERTAGRTDQAGGAEGRLV